MVAAIVIWVSLRGAPQKPSSVVVRGSAVSGLGGLAPGFSLPTTAGSTFRFPTQRPTLVYFMAGWCGTCVPEAQALARVAPSVGSRADLVAVDADPSDSWASLRGFVAAVGTPAYVFAKDDGKLDQAFGVNALDTTIGIDASGRVAYRNIGGLDDAGVKAALAKIGVTL